MSALSQRLKAEYLDAVLNNGINTPDESGQTPLEHALDMVEKHKTSIYLKGQQGIGDDLDENLLDYYTDLAASLEALGAVQQPTLQLAAGS